MPTAPAEPTPDQLTLAHEMTALPGTPPSLSDTLLRRQRVAPEQSLQESYLRQHCRFRHRDTELLLVSAGSPRYDLLPAYPSPERPVHLLTAWNTNGMPGTIMEFQQAQNTLWSIIEPQQVLREDATAIAEDGSWFEGLLVAYGMEDDRAVALAREFGQAAALRWQDDQMTVLPTGLRPSVEPASTPVRLVRLPSRTCPVRLDVDPTGRCVTWGGPYTSGSIHAAALWGNHRGVGVRLMGCDSCDDKKEPSWGVGGGAVNLADIVLASRYGNATWR